VTNCLNAGHDPKDVLVAADMHEALLDFHGLPLSRV